MLVSRVVRELKKPKEKRVAAENAIYQARRRLANMGLIKYKDKFWRITEEGRRELQLMGVSNFERPKRWDKKWRILIFDIREQRRQVRFRLRALLQGAGFVRLQDSVWVYPYPCDEFVALVRAHLASGVGELRSLVAEALESDRSLREHFNLPSNTFSTL